MPIIMTKANNRYLRLYAMSQRLINRLDDARKNMNMAPTIERTQYWFRVWRARRRALTRLSNQMGKTRKMP